MIMIFYLLPGITLGGFFWGEEMMDLMCSECVIKTTLFLRKMILWVLFFFKDRPATNMVAYYSLYYYWLYSNNSWTKSLSIKLIRSACSIILLRVIWTVLSGVCSKFFCSSTGSELTQRCTNHRIGRILVKLSGMGRAVWLTLSSCILKLARFLIHGSHSSATWQVP